MAANTRYVLIEVHTQHQCKDAEDYETAARAMHTDLCDLLCEHTQSFYRRCAAVEAIDMEGRYEESGIVLDALLTLVTDEQTEGPSTGADITKPALAKLLKSKFGWILTTKRVVPKPLEPIPEPAPAADNFQIHNV